MLEALSPAHRLAVAQELHRTTPRTRVGLSAAQADLVRDVAEAIFPRTDTPGATDAGVAEFVDLLLAEWYAEDDRDQFLAGLTAIDAEGRALAADGYLALPADARVAVLERLDAMAERPAGGAAWAFRRLKQLTVYAFFTSPVAAAAGLTGPVIPGRFDGCVSITGR